MPGVPSVMPGGATEVGETYDRRLDAIVAAAELGSFSRAAERLHISTPALVKQVSGFEAEHGLVLFTRSHSGVEPTSVGAQLVGDARRIMRECDEALARARAAGDAEGSVRLGKSMMAPARQTLALWPRVHELEPGLRLQIVPVGDLYVRDSVMTSLGGDVDVLQSSYSTVRWGGSCRLLRLFDVPFYVDVPRASSLAGRASVGPADLRGVRLRVLRHGNDAMDDLRDLLPKWGVEVTDVDSFDFALFNDAEAAGDAVLTCGAWSGVHPAFVGVPLECGRKVPCFLAYPTDPASHVARFVRAMRAVTSGAGPASRTAADMGR